MPTLKKGPKGGSYYISKKGKKVYSKAPPAKKDPDVKPKAKKDPLAGLDPALVAKVRSNPEAMKRLGLSPSESKTLVDLKKAKEKVKAKKDKPKAKKPAKKAKPNDLAKSKPKPKPKPKEKPKDKPKPKSKPKDKAKAKDKPSEDPSKAKPKEDKKASTAKKDTRRYLSGDDASPAEIKKMEKIEDRSFKRLSKGEQNAVKAYTGEDYEHINKKLRSGDPPTGHALEMDKALAKASLSQDMEVHRGFTLEGRPPPEIGSVMQDNAYMSTSHGQRRAEGFISRTEESVMMKVKVPKGAKAIYVGGNSKYGNEQELLLDRGAQVKFTSRKKVGNVWHYEAELVSTNQSRL